MKLTSSQLKTITKILNDYPSDNIQSINNQDCFSSVIVSSVTRSQVLKLDTLLDKQGVSIVPNDENTIKIIL